MIDQYRVTYDSIDKIFVVHMKYQEKPSMEFKMNKYGLHYYNPTDKEVVLINTISKNKQVFPKRKINGAEQAKTLYSKLGYPSVEYFRWIFQIQKIIECTVTVQGIDIEHEILGKNIAA